MTKSAAQIAALVEALLADGVLPGAIGRAVAAYVERPSSNITTDNRKGRRLPPDWQPSEPCIAYALDRGMNRARIDVESERFRNYWLAKSGSGATKRDWSATWRNWIITAMERGNGSPNYRGPGSGTDSLTRRTATGSDAVITAMGRIARRVDERRISEIGGRRPMAHNSDTAGELDLMPERTR